MTPATVEASTLPVASTQPPARKARALSRIWRRFSRGISLLALVCVIAGCTPPEQATRGEASPLYVAIGPTGTVSRLEVQRGAPLGPPLAAGHAPWRMTVGLDGSLFVISVSPGRSGEITHIARRGETWTTRTIALEEGARFATLAADRSDLAAVAYLLPPPPDEPLNDAGGPTLRCQIGMLDLHTGAIDSLHSACGPRDALFSVAMQDTDEGPIAYAGFWTWPAHTGGHWTGGHGGLVAIDIMSGAVLARLPMSGSPGQCQMASAPGRAGRRLYCVESLPGPQADSSAAESWRLLALTPLTLQVEEHYPLLDSPRALAFAPDGNGVYLLNTDGTAVRFIDLRTGTTSRLTRLPGAGVALAVNDERVFIPNPEGEEVWVLDRRRVFLHSLRVPAHPLGVALGR